MLYLFSLSLQLWNCSVIFALRRESVHHRTFLLGPGCCLNNVGQPLRTWKSLSCDSLRFSLNGWGESRDLFCTDEVLCVCPLEANSGILLAYRGFSTTSPWKQRAGGLHVALVWATGPIHCTLLNSDLQELVSMLTEEVCTQFCIWQIVRVQQHHGCSIRNSLHLL